MLIDTKPFDKWVQFSKQTRQKKAKDREERWVKEGQKKRATEEVRGKKLRVTKWS